MMMANEMDWALKAVKLKQNENIVYKTKHFNHFHKNKKTPFIYIFIMKTS